MGLSNLINIIKALFKFAPITKSIIKITYIIEILTYLIKFLIKAIT